MAEDSVLEIRIIEVFNLKFEEIVKANIAYDLKQH
jgi:hypothetical protein